MDWRPLWQNSWFQLGGLVTILSLGALGYDLAAGRLGGRATTAAARPAQTPALAAKPPAPTPTPFAKLTAKTRGQWIVDAAGAADADSRDLRIVVASAADNETVTVRAGNYPGGFAISRNVRFVAQGAVSIRTTDRNTVLVSGGRVVFEHFTIALDARGDQFCAVQATGDGRLELVDCLVGSSGKFDGYVRDNATLDARDSRFQTAGGGCALKYINNTRGQLERCEISSNNFGVEAINAAQLEILGCTFSKNGLANGTGNILAVSGGQAQVSAVGCAFTHNSATVRASESGTLILNGCTFRENGVTGEQGNTSDGLVHAQSGARVTCDRCTLESNRQGISAFGGSHLSLTGVKITGTGLQTDNLALKPYSTAVYATELKTTVALSSSTIADSVSDGVMITDGAALTTQDVTISGSGRNALTLGYAGNAASRAGLTRTRFLNNHVDGLYLCGASLADAQSCEFSDNTAGGVEVDGANSHGLIRDSVCRNNKGIGFCAINAGLLTATSCTLENNKWGAQAGLANKAAARASLELVNCTVRANTNFGVGACQESSVTVQGGVLGAQRLDVYKETGAAVRQTP